MEPFFAAGLTEGLTAELGRIETVRVIASATTMRYQNRRVALADLVRDTGASLVVRGSVSQGRRRRSGRGRAPGGGDGPCALVRRRTSGHVRTLQALYGTIATAISRAIAVELGEDDRARFSTARAVAPEVYEAYLKGRYYWNQRTDESLRTAVAELRDGAHRSTRPMHRPMRRSPTATTCSAP